VSDGKSLLSDAEFVELWEGIWNGPVYRLEMFVEPMRHLLSLAKEALNLRREVQGFLELGKRARAIYDCMTRYTLPRPYPLLTKEDALTLLRELVERCEAVGGEKGEGG
jgi:hypothetical protein